MKRWEHVKPVIVRRNGYARGMRAERPTLLGADPPKVLSLVPMESDSRPKNMRHMSFVPFPAV
jgi:hypothetical protein